MPASIIISALQLSDFQPSDHHHNYNLSQDISILIILFFNGQRDIFSTDNICDVSDINIHLGRTFLRNTTVQMWSSSSSSKRKLFKSLKLTMIAKDLFFEGTGEITISICLHFDIQSSSSISSLPTSSSSSS